MLCPLARAARKVKMSIKRPHFSNFFGMRVFLTLLGDVIKEKASRYGKFKYYNISVLDEVPSLLPHSSPQRQNCRLYLRLCCDAFA